MAKGPKSEKWKQAMRGRVFSDEHRRNLAAAQMGHTRNLGSHRSSETGRKISAALAGREVTAETRAKISAAGKGRVQSPEEIEKRRLKLCGHTCSIETRRKISESQKGRPVPDDRRLKISNSGKRVWATRNPEERRLLTLLWRQAAYRSQPTVIELAVCRVLDELGIVYETQVSIDRYVVDILIPDRRLVIECDGSYWHSLPGAAEKDRKRDRRLKELGYKVVRLPEEDIRQDPKLALVSRVG